MSISAGISGMIIGIFLPYIMSQSFFIGLIVGIIISFGDFLNGYIKGFSIMEKLVEFGENVYNYFTD